MTNSRPSVEHEPGAAVAGPHALPAPTIWPMTLAGGLTLLAAGFATSYFVSVMGLVLLAWALCGWVRDLQWEDDGVHAEDEMPATHTGGRHG